MCIVMCGAGTVRVLVRGGKERKGKEKSDWLLDFALLPEKAGWGVGKSGGGMERYMSCLFIR